MTKNQTQFSSQKIITFLLLTFGITALFDIPAVLLKVSDDADTLFTTASMWCPAIAVVLTKWIYKENIRDLNWKWPKTKYIVSAFAIPVLYGLVTYLIIWTTGWGSFYNTQFVNEVASSYGIPSLSPGLIIFIFVVMKGIFGMFKSCSNALGEEIGWRGFLVPELFKKYGYIKTSLFTGVIWAVWHYTSLIFGNYNNDTPTWYGLICFTVMIIAFSFILTWFTIKSGSLFPAMVLHAAHNLYIQRIFTPLTMGNEKTPWFIDEFGAVLPVVAVVFAIYFIYRRKDLIAVPIS
jgi:membrane protease YdiL (CAAX protease family)